MSAISYIVIRLFLKEFLKSVHIFICLACQWTSQAFTIFNRGHTALNLENHLKSCVLPIFRSLKRTFNVLKVSIAFFPSLKKNLIQTCCSVESAISGYVEIALQDKQPEIELGLLV
jgi:hypothetical protein